MAASDLTRGSVPRHLVRLATPVALAMTFQSIYALVDLAFVGRLGEDQVAGLSISLQAFFIVLALSQSIAVTALAEVSQAYGRGDVEHARGTFSAFCVVAVVVGLVSMVAAYLSAGLYVGTFTDDPTVLRLGTAYFEITAITFLLQLLLIVFGNGLRGSGDFTTPMKFMALSVGLNIVLDPILIFGLGPVPAFGLVGAAWATVGSQGVALSLYALRLARPGGERALFWRRPAWSRQLATRFVTRGLPASVQFFLISVVLGMILRSVKPLGPAWTATAGGGFRVMQQTFLPMVALGSASAALVGQNLGAGLPSRVSEAIFRGLRWAAAYGLVVAVLLFVFGAEAGHLFAKGPEEIALAGDYFRWSAPSTVAYAFTFIPMFTLQAAGRSVLPLLAAMTRVALLGIALFVVLPALDVTPLWIFGAQTATAFVEGLLATMLVVRFLRGLRRD